MKVSEVIWVNTGRIGLAWRETHQDVAEVNIHTWGGTIWFQQD